MEIVETSSVQEKMKQLVGRELKKITTFIYLLRIPFAKTM
jgi:hypothetical protein